MKKSVALIKVDFGVKRAELNYYYYRPAPGS